MANKFLQGLLTAFALVVLVSGGAWIFRSRLHVPAVLAPVLTPESAATPAAAAPGSLETAVRALMPGAGLFREDWLRRDGDTWNLKIPRRRDSQALAVYFQAGLEHAGLKPTVFQLRDFPQWRGFYLEAGGDKLVAVEDKAPAMAIVIDDWGYHVKALQAMKNFPGRLTVAVLPGLQYSAVCADTAFGAGHEVILHLPMEPERKMPMLEGTLLVGMPLAEVDSWMDRDAATVPHMSGLNNHEGSKGSADPVLMQAVCGWLKRHGEFFLDSKTSPASVGEAEARNAGIPYAARRIFLDDVDESGAIEKEAREALAIALRTGSCIAIGHPRKNTMDVLTRMAPVFENEGVDLVRISELTYFDVPKP